jgi:2-desacetyl-2-hydroxyethyl bacteriochlorophyllide A dehydrogenase
MKCLTCLEPGKFQYAEKSKPVLAKRNAIIKIKRIGICGTDLHAFEGKQPFFTYPRILGHELAGELEDVDGVTDFRPGEIATFIPYLHCGSCVACRKGKTNCCVNLKVYGVHIDGGMVEYLEVPAQLLVHGDGLSFDELALVEPLAIGAHAVRRAQVNAGEFVLVCGAGPIGLGAMEFARVAGGRIIALDVNEKRLAFCKEKLDVAYTLNALSGNVREQLLDITSGDMPTLVMDATGNREAINAAFQYMSHGARYVLIGLQRGDVSFSHPEFHKREGTLMSSRNATREDFQFVMQAMASGKINPKIYITHRVKFSSVKDEFEKWLDPSTGVIKAMVDV